MTESESKNYEISFLARDEKGAQAVLGLLKKWNCEVSLEGPLERIVLAYKIKRETSAHFGYFHFRLDKDQIKPLSQELRTRDMVLRFLIITPPFIKSKARPVSKPRVKSAPTPVPGRKPAPLPLSNEALERTIEEILK